MREHKPFEGALAKRTTSAWLQLTSTAGICITSIYGQVGPTEKQLREELSSIHKWATAERSPWVIIGDFNVDPERIQQTNLPGFTKSTLMATSGDTCISGDIKTRRDYALVSNKLLSAGMAMWTHDYGVRPRLSVHLRLKQATQPSRLATTASGAAPSSATAPPAQLS
eukprot:6454997-Amphidinium_carterae.1